MDRIEKEQRIWEKKADITSAGHALEFNAAIAFARVAISNLILINGIAVVGVLMFYGNLISSPQGRNQASISAENLEHGLHYFMGGLAFGLLCALTAYMAQYVYTKAFIDKVKAVQNSGDSKMAELLHSVTVGAAVLSLGFFILGALYTANSFFHSQNCTLTCEAPGRKHVSRKYQ